MGFFWMYVYRQPNGVEMASLDPLTEEELIEFSIKYVTSVKLWKIKEEPNYANIYEIPEKRSDLPAGGVGVDAGRSA